MNNKTVVFDAQKEIAELKRRVQQLENEKNTYGPTYQPPQVPGYPAQPLVFGPGSSTGLPADWPKTQSMCKDAVDYFNGETNKESND